MQITNSEQAKQFTRQKKSQFFWEVFEFEIADINGNIDYQQ